MSTKRFKQILPTSKFALSTEEDTYTSVSVDGDMREIPEVETDENVLSDEVNTLHEHYILVFNAWRIEEIYTFAVLMSL